jgi:L-seryl-tRNA(Ser) seleniumtransferase
MRLGVDLLTCSGDKLIGGPQSGIILGKREWIDRIRTNPLFRALRVDKMTLVAMEATLRLFLRPDGPGDAHPSWRMLRRDPQELARAANDLAETIRRDADPFTTELEPGFSQVGSGSLPGESLPTTLVRLVHPSRGASALARALRHSDPPVYTRIVDDRVCLDPRTIQEGEEEMLLEVLRKLA